MLPPEAMLVFVVQAAATDHVDAHGPCGCLRSVVPKEVILASVVHAAAGGHINTCVSGDMVICVVHATNGGHVGICGVCCHLRPC